MLHYQGRVLVDGRVLEGSGYFKFALVGAEDSPVWWRNAPDDNGDGEPDAAVAVPVGRGLYSLLLGDTRLANMAALPETTTAPDPLVLRVWFSDGTGPFEQMTPDQPLAATAFSLLARTVEDGAITTAKLAPDAITPAQIPPLDAAKITSGQLAADRLPTNVVFRDADLAPVQAVIAGLSNEVTVLSARLAALQAGESGAVRASRDPDDPDLAAAGFARLTSLPAPAWQDANAADAPSPRRGHSAIWTGSEWVVWGGLVAGPESGQNLYSDAGAAYRPDSRTWTPLPQHQTTAPTARSDHSAVWTGTEMIIWGGEHSPAHLNTGGRYVPASQDWLGMTSSNAPAGREGHVAAWCAGRMVIWGGRDHGGLRADGALYASTTDSWQPLAFPGAPSARQSAAVAVVGNTVFLWGGEDESGPLASGAALDLSPGGYHGRWRTLPAAGAPSARHHHSMIWTGARLLVWGGVGADGQYRSDGAAYDPARDVWEPLPVADAPAARARHNALWTGSEMLIVGGDGAAGPLASGGAFDPRSSRWRPLASEGGPVPRHSAAAAWTGGEILLFGGVGDNGILLAALERLDPAGAWHLFRKP